MMVQNQFLLLLIIGRILREGICQDHSDQKAFDEAVLEATCIFKYSKDKARVKRCTSTITRDAVKALDQDARADIRIVCRDNFHLMVHHDGGLFVIEKRLDGGNWEGAAPINITKNQVQRFDISPRGTFQMRSYRILAKGITRPEESETIQTMPIGYEPKGVRNITMGSLGFKPEKRHKYSLRQAMSFTPSEVMAVHSWYQYVYLQTPSRFLMDAIAVHCPIHIRESGAKPPCGARPTIYKKMADCNFCDQVDETKLRPCSYLITLRPEDGTKIREYEVVDMDQPALTLTQLSCATNYTVSIRSVTEVHGWLNFTNVEETAYLSTHSCLDASTKKRKSVNDYARRENYCIFLPVNEQDTRYIREICRVRNLNATVTHKGGNIFDIHVMWSNPTILPDGYYVHMHAYSDGEVITHYHTGLLPANESKTVFSDVIISKQFVVSVSSHIKLGRGIKTSRRFEIQSAPAAVEGLNATAIHTADDTFDVHVTWKKPALGLSPDFYIVSIDPNIPATAGLTYHSVPGSVAETVFSNVKLSEEIHVSVKAFSSAGGEGPESSGRFRTSPTPIRRKESDVFTPISLAGTILVVICIGIGIGISLYVYYRFRKRRLTQNLPVDKYEINPDRLSIKQVLGNGAFGVVKLGTLRDNRGNTTTVAVKMLRDDSNENEQRNFRREIEFMKTLGKHPNIVSLVGYHTTSPYPFLVVEYCSRGDLHSFLQKSIMRTTVPGDETNKCTALNEKVPQQEAEICQQNSEGSSTSLNSENYIKFSSLVEDQGTNGGANILTVMDMLNFGRQIATGMEFLSSSRIVHRDLAARNVLLSRKLTIKISDFGMSRDVYGENIYKKCGNGRMPFKWMAIESLTHQVYSTFSDVWSFGVLLWEIVTQGASPYPGIPTMKILKQLQMGYRMERPANCSLSLYNVMLSCWRARPNDRPTFTILRQELDKLISVTTTKEYFDLDEASEELPSENDDSQIFIPDPTSCPQEVKFVNELEPITVSEDQGQSDDEAKKDPDDCDEISEATDNENPRGNDYC